MTNQITTDDKEFDKYCEVVVPMRFVEWAIDALIDLTEDRDVNDTVRRAQAVVATDELENALNKAVEKEKQRLVSLGIACAIQKGKSQ